MTPAEIRTTFGKAQTLLNAKGYRLTRVEKHDARDKAFRLYQLAYDDPASVGLPVSYRNRGLGIVLVPGEKLVAYLFLFDGTENYNDRLPTPVTEPLDVVLSGGHVRWTNALLKELRYLDYVEAQSGLPSFKPEAVPDAVYKAVK